MSEIGINRFEVGMAVEVMYITPDNGQPTMNLKDSSGNIILHVNPRWDERALVLNTFSGGWGPEERPRGFDFSSGVPITIRVEAKPDHFAIIVNGHVIHHYRHRIPVNNICKVDWNWSSKGGSKGAKLIKLSVCY